MKAGKKAGLWLLVALATAGLSYVAAGQWRDMRRADAAWDLLESDPDAAFQKLVAEERASTEEYVSRLYEICRTRIERPVPRDSDLRYLSRTLANLRRANSAGFGNADVYSRQLARLALESGPRIQSDGSLAAWDQWIVSVGGVDGRGGLLSGGNAEFAAWADAARSQEARQTAQAREILRDALATAQGISRASGRADAAPSTATIIALSGAYGEQKLIPLHGLLSSAISRAAEVQRDSTNAEIAPAMERAAAVLLLDCAALRARHLIDDGGAAARRGSAFIAEATLSSRGREAPSVGEMYDAFLANTRGIAQEGVRALERANAAPEEIAAVAALTQHNLGLLARSTGGSAAAPAGELRGAMGAAVEAAIRANPDELLYLTRPLTPIEPPSTLPPPPDKS